MTAMPVMPTRANTFAHVPMELRTQRAWLLWRAQTAGDRTAKVPFYAGSLQPRSGSLDEPSDIEQLADYGTAKLRLAQKKGDFTGLGFAVLPSQGLTALDFDKCIDADGKVDPSVVALVRHTYAEISPSGRGVRAFVRGHLPDTSSRACEGSFGFECYTRKRFVTITGEILEGSPRTIGGITPQLQAFAEQRLGRASGIASAPMAAQGGDDAELSRQFALRDVTAETIVDLKSAVASLPDDWAHEYNAWTKVGLALASLKDTEFAEQALDLWHQHSARSAKYDREDAQRKWDGFKPTDITFRTLFEIAQGAGWRNPRLKSVTGEADHYCRLEDRTDTGNANLMIRLSEGDLRYVPERRTWMAWDGERWSIDAYGTLAQAAALKVAEAYHGKAEDLKKEAADKTLSEDEQKRIGKIAEGVKAWAERCRGHRALNDMTAIARRDTRTVIPAADLDTDPWLLGVDNGVVDLKTGKLRPAGRDEFVTRHARAAYEPGAKAKRWERFVEEITGKPLPVEYDKAGEVVPGTVGRFKPRPDLAAYLQRLAGYWLTGSTVEQKLFILIGPGSNGKNIFLDTLQGVLGDYATTIPPEALMASRHEGDAERASPVLAGLAGVRLAISSESREGQSLDVPLVKRHTGGGYIVARLLRENPFRFLISHKLALMTNAVPRIDHLDDAIRGRLHLIPFDRQWNRPGHPERNPTLPDGDKGLMDVLAGETAGVLAWAIEGARLYQMHGLNPPAEVVAQTRSYLAAQDPLGSWLETMERCDAAHGTAVDELKRMFDDWLSEEWDGPTPAREVTFTAFGLGLQKRGITKRRAMTGRFYGLREKNPAGGQVNSIRSAQSGEDIFK